MDRFPFRWKSSFFFLNERAWETSRQNGQEFPERKSLWRDPSWFHFFFFLLSRTMILPLSFTNDNLLVMRQVLLWKSALSSLRIVVDQRGRPWNSSNVIHNNFLCSFMLLQRDTLVPRASVSFDHVVGETEPLVNDISRRVALGTRMAKETKTASIVWQLKTLSTLGRAFRNPHYHTDTGVLLKNTPRKIHTKLHLGPEWLNFRILTSKDVDDVISRFFTAVCVWVIVCLYNKKRTLHVSSKIWILFSWQEQYLTCLLRSLARYCFYHSHIKFICSRHRVISPISFITGNVLEKL